jgi:hypothetical protein
VNDKHPKTAADAYKDKRCLGCDRNWIKKSVMKMMPNKNDYIKAHNEKPHGRFWGSILAGSAFFI